MIHSISNLSLPPSLLSLYQTLPQRPIPSISINKPKPLPSPPHNPLNLPNNNNMIPNPHHPLPKSPTLDHIQHPLPLKQRRLPILLNNLNPLRQPLKQALASPSVPPRKQIRNPRALPPLRENMHIEDPAALVNRIQRPARRPDVERHQRHGLHAQAHETRHRHAPWPTRAVCGRGDDDRVRYSPHHAAELCWEVGCGVVGCCWGLVGFSAPCRRWCRWFRGGEVSRCRVYPSVVLGGRFESGSAGGRLLRSLAGRRDAARSPAHELRSSHAPELSPKSLYGVARSRSRNRQSNKAIDGATEIHAGLSSKESNGSWRGYEGRQKLDFLTPLKNSLSIRNHSSPGHTLRCGPARTELPGPDQPKFWFPQVARPAGPRKDSSPIRASIAKSFKQILLFAHARRSPSARRTASASANPSPRSSQSSFSPPIQLSFPPPLLEPYETSAKMGKLPTHLPRPTSLLSHRPSLTTSSCSGATLSASSPRIGSIQQSRAATFIPRPRRPYTFTQLIQLSDGSTYTVRTTSPSPLVRSAKDSRNHALWQPSDKSLKNVEVDEAGKLAAFRERFGRGFDLAAKKPTEEELNAAAAAAATSSAKDAGKGAAGKDAAATGKDAAAAAAPAKETAKPAQPAATPEDDDIFDMGDLISGYAAMQPQQAAKEPPKKVAAPEKGKKGKK
ncbi:mitochondrial ribosomal protein [Colletotrichum scovillei]|nr:mitochondrial ribosomal protein [Colletotrichum scovillei]